MTGGLQRADEENLSATLDLLSLTGLSDQYEPVTRARDLLISHITRGCQRHREDHAEDRTATVAAASLRTLMLRPRTDTRKAAKIRAEAIGSAGHHVSTDAVRKREDKIIKEIAQAVLVDLQSRREDEPRSLEAAIHAFVPIAADVRQDLHDLLCATFARVPPADPHERSILDGYYRMTVIKLGELLLASARLASLGLRSPRMSEDDYFFMRNARLAIGLLFDQAAEDREFMLSFMRSDQSRDWEERLDHLLASSEGTAVYERWLAWAKSCYPTCEFERSTELLNMCSPHTLITMLYEIELGYNERGFSALNIDGNRPILHHRVPVEQTINPDRFP
jgi:hypothetical protein